MSAERRRIIAIAAALTVCLAAGAFWLTRLVLGGTDEAAFTSPPVAEASGAPETEAPAATGSTPAATDPTADGPVSRTSATEKGTPSRRATSSSPATGGPTAELAADPPTPSGADRRRLRRGRGHPADGPRPDRAAGGPSLGDGGARHQARSRRRPASS